DEFSLFREGLLTVDDLPTNPARLAAFGLTGQVEWDKLYGDFASGTARKASLVNMEHHFLPLTQKAVTEAVDWMQNSLMAGQSKMDPSSHVYWWKVLLGLVSLLAAIFMLIPLTNLFLATEFFKPVSQSVPSGYVAPKKKWWTFAVINFLIGGITYPIFTQWSALSDKYQAIFPLLRLQVGNGVFVWLLVNAVISAILFTIWYRQSKKTGEVQLKDLGVVSTEEEKKQGVLGKTILLAVVMFLCLYLVQALFQLIFKQEIRFVWPFMRQFSNFTRVWLFLLYLIPTIAFWLINGGLFLFGQMHLKEEASPSKTQWVWWAKACFAFLTGLLIVWMIQYLPWYLANAGPGFELLKLPQFSALWPLMLQVYIPEFLILIWILVWFYRRTGRIYLGAFMVSSLMIWFLAAGSVVAK
ncbi:MAG TPA: hypothetical protein VLR89_04400, partial [Anaerolineaceae bacterium]|nr:hypothetical protein [Anaerolineaceae bacterium]